jgi:solute carrier family 36 (proton-coupled amino acid transporter)
VIEFHTNARIDLRLYILMVGGFAIILAMVRNLRFMAPISLLSNALVMASVVIVFIYIFDDLPSISTREPFMPLSKLPIFFSIIVYSLEGINVVSLTFKDTFMAHSLLGIIFFYEKLIFIDYLNCKSR